MILAGEKTLHSGEAKEEKKKSKRKNPYYEVLLKGKIRGARYKVENDGMGFRCLQLESWARKTYKCRGLCVRVERYNKLSPREDSCEYVSSFLPHRMQK